MNPSVRRWLGYGAGFALMFSCRSAMVRGDEGGCEDAQLEGIDFANDDRDQCLPPDPFRQSYGFRGCGQVLHKETYRDAHQDGWERCFVEAYEATYPADSWPVPGCEGEDTGLDPDDTCTPLQVGPDLALRRTRVLEQDFACGAANTEGMVTSEEAYLALFTCDPGVTPPASGVDWMTEDAFVQIAVFAELGVTRGVYDDQSEVYLLAEQGCPQDQPPLLFRGLQVTVVPKGLTVQTTLDCRSSACD